LFPANGLGHLVALAKEFRAPGPVLPAIWGVYGGQYAKLFEPPFNAVASWICIAAMVIGLGFIVIRSFRQEVERRDRGAKRNPK